MKAKLTKVLNEDIESFEGSPVEVKDVSSYIGKVAECERVHPDEDGIFVLTFEDGAVGSFYGGEIEMLVNPLPEAFLKEMRDDIRKHMEDNSVSKVFEGEIYDFLKDTIEWEDCAWVTVGDWELYFFNTALFISVNGMYYISDKDLMEVKSEIRSDCGDCGEEVCPLHIGHLSYDELSRLKFPEEYSVN